MKKEFANDKAKKSARLGANDSDGSDQNEYPSGSEESSSSGSSDEDKRHSISDKKLLEKLQ